MGRPVRQRRARGASVVGRTHEVTVGPVAHGGSCVARVPDGAGERVVFVRHALPGEHVVVRLTEGSEGDRFWRGDAIEVRSASPDRVPPPCPYAGPDACGGCDFQHVALDAQRRLKADVVREQLVRLGRLPGDHPLLTGLVVEAVPGDDGGLAWRTRQRYARLPDGTHAMRKHRSHDLVPIDRCLIATDDAQPLVLPLPRAHHTVTAAGTTHTFTTAPGGFWQVHPGAPTVLVETVLAMLEPRPGESVLDLYAGVGLFSRFLLDVVGSASLVAAVEGDLAACERARLNLDEGVRVSAGSVDRVLATSYDEGFDLVVLDPPREGAKRSVVEQVVERRPRAVACVACDPAALARDVALFAERGYRLTALRAFDLFPMTHHVECVALLER